MLSRMSSFSASSSSSSSSSSRPAGGQAEILSVAVGVAAVALSTYFLHSQYRLRNPTWKYAGVRLHKQLQARALGGPPVPAPATCTWIVTGASAGIGMHTALMLRKAGYKVILAVRDVSRGVKAAQWINSQMSSSSEDLNSATFQNPTAPLQVYECDVGDLASMRAFVGNASRLFHDPSAQVRFAGLLNNAGMIVNEWEVDENGWEQTMKVNHLGAAGLAMLMQPLLQASAAHFAELSGQSHSPSIAYSRIVNVTSRYEASGYLTWLDPFYASNLGKNYDKMAAYARSKLALMQWGYEFQRSQLVRPSSRGTAAASRVGIVSVTPGFVRTSLNRNGSFLTRMLFELYQFFNARTVELGAEAVFYSCIVPVDPLRPMLYTGECQEIESSVKARDESAAKETAWRTQELLQQAETKQKVAFVNRKKLLDAYRRKQEEKASVSWVADDNVIRVFQIPANAPAGAFAPAAKHRAFLSFKGRVYPCAIGRNGIAPLSQKKEGDGCSPAAALKVRAGFVKLKETTPSLEELANFRAMQGVCIMQEQEIVQLVGDENRIDDLLKSNRFPVLPVHADDVWIDDAAYPSYNTYESLVSLLPSISSTTSSSASVNALPSFEYLRLDSPIYDVFLVLGHNDYEKKSNGERGTVQGKGSAIFFHIALGSLSSEATVLQSASASAEAFAALANANELAPTAGCVALTKAHLLEVLKDIDAQTVLRIAEKEQDTLNGSSSSSKAASSSSSSSQSSSSSTPGLFKKHFAESTNATPSDGSTVPEGIQFAGAADRNKSVIAEALQKVCQHEQNTAQHFLEISSGTGQHVSHFAEQFPKWTFQPSDQNRDGFSSIQYHSRERSNVNEPLVLDLLQDKEWGFAQHSFDCIYVANMLHISSRGTTEGLFRASAAALKQADAKNNHKKRVCIYGPFMKDGKPTTDSNLAFHKKLQSMNSEYGLRDLSEVASAASEFGFEFESLYDMPSNNFLLVFSRRSKSASKKGHKSVTVPIPIPFTPSASASSSSSSSTSSSATSVHTAAEKGFHGSVNDLYEKGRPAYADECIDFLLRSTLLPILQARTSSSSKSSDRVIRIFDLGCGTGISTRCIANRLTAFEKDEASLISKAKVSFDLKGVEPVEGMRQRFEESCPGLTVIDGSAFSMPSVADSSVDVIFAAQAFHWFATAEALKEFQRVLRKDSPAYFLPIWNTRDESISWVGELEETLVDPLYGPEVPRQKTKKWQQVLQLEPKRFELVEEKVWQRTMVQKGDREMVIARIISISVIAMLPDAEKQTVRERIIHLLNTHPETKDRNNQYEIPYCTDAYIYRVVSK